MDSTVLDPNLVAYACRICCNIHARVFINGRCICQISHRERLWMKPVPITYMKYEGSDFLFTSFWMVVVHRLCCVQALMSFKRDR
ncbi:hypothetical protein O6P43_008816 [Quillaja saponaria]|uniref:Uncharacterized protein n=1 Tax=Quillaja saponaria TaxID=32244 RepID=A0AAD7M631_QUISA|nr:hypothetical protein O6P43_008816 [Quillaja saponaria]